MHTAWRLESIYCYGDSAVLPIPSTSTSDNHSAADLIHSSVNNTMSCNCGTVCTCSEPLSVTMLSSNTSQENNVCTLQSDSRHDIEQSSFSTVVENPEMPVVKPVSGNSPHGSK